MTPAEFQARLEAVAAFARSMFEGTAESIDVQIGLHGASDATCDALADAGAHCRVNHLGDNRRYEEVSLRRDRAGIGAYRSVADVRPEVRP